MTNDRRRCEDGDEQMHTEWHYHVGRRFVPALHRKFTVFIECRGPIIPEKHYLAYP